MHGYSLYSGCTQYTLDIEKNILPLYKVLYEAEKANSHINGIIHIVNIL